MTNKLEKQFFDTFGIEQRGKKCTCDVRDFAKCTTYYCTSCAKALKKEYPRITPEILLELFDILRTAYNIDFWSIDGDFVMDLRDKQAGYTNIFYRTGGDLKTSILSSLNLVVKQNFIGNDTIKHQVRTLFEEV